jgi:sRNA-binding regulator protein Hfq
MFPPVAPGAIEKLDHFVVIHNNQIRNMILDHAMILWFSAKAG